MNVMYWSVLAMLIYFYCDTNQQQQQQGPQKVPQFQALLFSRYDIRPDTKVFIVVHWRMAVHWVVSTVA